MDDAILSGCPSGSGVVTHKKYVKHPASLAGSKEYVMDGIHDGTEMPLPKA